MKFRLGVILCATLFCCDQANAELGLLSKLSEKDPWKFMEYHLFKGPSERVKSYKERRINLAASVSFWIACLALGAKASYHNDNYQYRSAERAGNVAAIAAILGLLTTTWSIIRNCWFLVWAAEKEMLNELLDNWSNIKQALPSELVDPLHLALKLRTTNPEQFNKELAPLISALQQETDIHVYDRHYYSLRHSFYRLIHALRDRTAAQAKAAEMQANAANITGITDNNHA